MTSMPQSSTAGGGKFGPSPTCRKVILSILMPRSRASPGGLKVALDMTRGEVLAREDVGAVLLSLTEKLYRLISVDRFVVGESHPSIEIARVTGRVDPTG